MPEHERSPPRKFGELSLEAMWRITERECRPDARVATGLTITQVDTVRDVRERMPPEIETE